MRKEGIQERCNGFVNVAVVLVLTCVVFGVVRMLLMSRILEWGIIYDNIDSLPLMLYNALRYDLQVGAYVVIPLFVLALVRLFVGGRFDLFCSTFANIYVPIIIVLIMLLGVSDVHFYANFNQHFNIVAFDFLDENPLVLLEGIMKEAPFLLIAVGIVIAVVLSVYGVKVLRRLIGKMRGSVVKAWIFTVLMILLVPIFIRGSLGTFPLRSEDVYVSSSNAINDCVPNGVFMLKKAWSEKKKQFALQTEEEILRLAGMKDEREAIEILAGGKEDVMSVEDIMYITTKDTVIAEGYNVVLILTESWSNVLIDYETLLGADLLCGMRKHFEEDYLFRNFVSAANGTIDAVEFMTVNAIHPRLFTSRYRTCEYPTANAKIWHDAGYETSFVSGIEISWRNLMEVLPKQSFDNVIGKYEFLKMFPNAECNTTWGVYDHEMLSYINSIINTDGKPHFVMALTSTSHTPFEFPDNHVFPEINITDKSREYFATDDDVTIEYLKGYQYENKALSDFLDKFKTSEAAKNTIVVITGDHNIRQILSYKDEEQWRKYSVPLYIYVPRELRGSIDYDATRYGSHHDIIPTLAELTVARGKYFNTGENLFDNTLSGVHYGVNRETIIAPLESDKGDITRHVAAREALTKIYFQRLWNSRID